MALSCPRRKRIRSTPVSGWRVSLNTASGYRSSSSRRSVGFFGNEWDATATDIAGSYLESVGDFGASIDDPVGCGIPEHVDLESKYGYDGSMKTTIDIPENELRDAMRFTRATTKREAVVKVLEEFNRRRRMAELVKYSGTFSDRFPTNDEIEAIDA